MTEDRHVLREIAWPEVFPGVLLLSVWRLAINVRALLLAAAGLLATMLVWWGLAQMFASTVSSEQASPLPPFVVPENALLQPPHLMDAGQFAPRSLAESSPIATAWSFFTTPMRGVFATNLTVGQSLSLLVAALLMLAIWAFVGGALSRMAVVDLARGEKLSWGQLFSHARSKWPSYFAAPLFPLFGVLLAAIPLAVLGLIMKAGSGGVVITALLWPFVLLVGVVMAILLVGLFLNWPLMWATISAEGTDSFDALSRSYAYSFQRPLRYFGYLVLASLLGSLLMVLVNLFAFSVLQLSYWAISLGSGTPTLEHVLAMGEHSTPLSPTGYKIMNFWNHGVSLFVAAFVVAYFFSAMAAIYLLLRFHVDATETDEVFLPDEDDPHGLPPLRVDAAGVPGVGDSPASSTAAASSAVGMTADAPGSAGPDGAFDQTGAEKLSPEG